MSVLNRDYVKYLKKNIIFIVAYTIVFVLIYNTFEYIAPFLIGGVIALLINPISTKLKSKFNINKGISTIILSFLAVIIFISLVGLIIMTSIDNILEFIENIPNNYEYFNRFIEELNLSINTYLEQLKNIPSINVEGIVGKYTKEMIQILDSFLDSMVGIVSSIPYIVIFILTLFMSTYFIAKDIDKIENKFYNMFTEPTKSKVKNVKKEILKSALGYIKAYTILMGITFIVTWISFKFFKIPYALLLSIVAAILDLVPFLGIVVIYLPIIIYYFMINAKVLSICIAVIFLMLSILREILEPKLVSVNIGISPLAALGAIFIGVQVNGIIGIVFFLGLIVMHKIFRKVDII